MFTTPLHPRTTRRWTRSARRAAPKQQGFRSADAFTLVELLVVILIMGILMAIVIPSFLGQTTKGSDTQAIELARTAQTTAQSIATDNDGSYATVTPAELHKNESTIPVGTGTPTNGAWLTAASGDSSGYTVTVTSTTGDTFTVERTGQGVDVRSCTEEASSKGCPTGSW